METDDSDDGIEDDDGDGGDSVRRCRPSSDSQRCVFRHVPLCGTNLSMIMLDAKNVLRCIPWLFISVLPFLLVTTDETSGAASPFHA